MAVDTGKIVSRRWTRALVRLPARVAVFSVGCM